MSSRPARLGFFALAAVICINGARSFYLSHLIAQVRQTSNIDGITPKLMALEYTWYALQVITIAAAIAASMLPEHVGARRWMRAVAVIALVQIGMYVAQRLFNGSSAMTHDMELYKLVYKISWTASANVSFVSTLASGIAILRIGRAAKQPRAPAVAFGTTIPALLTAIPSIIMTISFDEAFSPAVEKVFDVYADAASVAHAGGFVWAAFQVPKLPFAAPEEDAPGSVKVGPEWHPVASGIYLYLLAAVIRVIIAIFTFATVRSAGDAYDSYTSMHSLRDQIMTLAYVGGAASLMMIGAVVMIARAPAERVRSPAIVVIVCMLLGLLLDAVTSSMTASAMTSVSAAFSAMDLLPIIAAVATGLGAFSAWLLFRALAEASVELGLTENARRARIAGTVAIIAGEIGAVTQLALKGLPVELLVPIAVLIVPAALFAAIQLVRVMLAIATVIQEKAAPRR